jgi:hypothetical protein
MGGGGAGEPDKGQGNATHDASVGKGWGQRNAQASRPFSSPVKLDSGLIAGATARSLEETLTCRPEAAP